MKKTVVRIVSALVLLAMTVVALAGCGSAGSDKYVIYSDKAFPPFEYLDEKTGEYIGLDMDILAAVAADQGFEYEVKNEGFDPAMTAVQSGQADGMIAGMTIKPERQEKFDFSDGYFEDGSILVVAEGSAIKSEADLAGKTVAAKTGTVSADYTESIKDKYGFEITYFEDSPSMYALMGCVEQGMTNAEIIRQKPSYAFRLKGIDEMRDTLQAERYRKENRAVQVLYFYGDSGTGKTRSIFASHKPEDICRITDYGGKNGTKFDAYHGQPVLVFEEFHSQIPIAAMLNYLDIYPLQLPARYHDRTACYTTVYITSNISLDEQYTEVQRSELETWRAFLRRIGCVKEFRKGKPPREVPFHDKRR